MNGIFIYHSFSIYEAFDGPPATISPRITYGRVEGTNLIQEGTLNDSDTEKVLTNLQAHPNTNVAFRFPYPGQKAIFKYPSNQHFGELKNPPPKRHFWDIFRHNPN